MTQLDYLLQTGHWQVLTDSYNTSPNDREAARKAFIEKCLTPMIEELKASITESEKTVTTLTHEYAELVLKRDAIQDRYDANTPYIAGLETRVKVAEEQRERAVMLHTDMESQYWKKRTECDELLVTCHDLEHIILEAEELRTTLALYRSMVRSGEQESEESKAAYASATRVRAHDKPTRTPLAETLEEVYREGHSDGHEAGGARSPNEDADWEDSNARTDAEAMK